MDKWTFSSALCRVVGCLRLAACSNEPGLLYNKRSPKCRETGQIGFAKKERTTFCQGFSLRDVIFRKIVNENGWEGVRVPNLLNENINSII